MNSLNKKLYDINPNSNQQYQSYLFVSSLLIIIIGILLSTVLFSSISAVGNTSIQIDANSLSELAPKPANTTETIDAKAFDRFMQSSIEEPQSKKSVSINNLMTTSSPHSFTIINKL